MFCPECGTLGFVEKGGMIRCTNYSCKYEGPVEGKDGKGAVFEDPLTGAKIDLAAAVVSVEEEKRDRRTQKEDKAIGILYEDSYMCPKCDCKNIFVWMQQTRSSDEPETKMCTCDDCGHKFREYQ